MTSHSTVSKPGHLAGQVGERDGERLLLVQAGDLDDQLHRDGERRYRARQTVIGSHGGHHAHPAAPGHHSRAARAERLGSRRPPGQDRLRAALRRLRRSGSSSSRPTRSTTPTTRCCGGAICCTATRWSSTGFRYPTEHPLAIAAGAILQLFGGWGDRLWVAMTLASFLVLIAGVYRLGRLAATPLVGAVAAALLMTRFDYPFLAARGYIDIPYMALVVWAACSRRAPRRGLPVLVAARARGDAAARGVVPRGDVLGVGRSWHATWRAAVHLRGAGRARPADVGDGRLPGHRQPAVLAAVHDRLRRGSRPPALAVRAARGDPDLLPEPRQAAGASSPPARGSC